MDAIKITSNRIAYIDLFKGIAIIGVVWVHSHIPPSWLTPFLVNSIFFFISGCFFNRRQDSFYNLIIKNTKRILIPFLFFSNNRSLLGLQDTIEFRLALRF